MYLSGLIFFKFSFKERFLPCLYHGPFKKLVLRPVSWLLRSFLWKGDKHIIFGIKIRLRA